MNRRRVLITGAAGRIGRALVDGLHERYRLRTLYNRTILEQRHDEECMVGSVSDLASMEDAAEGMDAVIHLAGDASPRSPFDKILQPNIIGAYNTLEACRRRGVKRLVFASTNRVTGMYEKQTPKPLLISWDAPVRPDSQYAASKAYGEALSRYYADTFGLSVLCLRIGTFRPLSAMRELTDERVLSTWLSPDDAVQLAWRCIEAPEYVRFAIYYGISANTRAFWDTQNARDEIGYEPKDDAEDYAGPPTSR